MKPIALAATTLGLAASVAHAGGLDRSYTPIDVIFEKGNYAELSFGFTAPTVTGVDLLGNPIANVADDFSQMGAALKIDYTDNFSVATIYDQPYGADVLYGGNPATTLLGGTAAKAESQALTIVGRYKINERVSVYGGPRFLFADGNIRLSGLAYGPLSGYSVRFNDEHGIGYVLGAAYEIPDIALRISGTYHSAIDMEFTTTDSFGTPAGKTKSELPQTFELAAQSGIAANTLLFGSVRWAEWSAFSLDPPNPLVPNLAQLDDVITYELGVGRKFSDKFSASIAVSYEDGGSDDLVSPLAPTNGQTAVTVGGKYAINDNVELSAGLRYTWLGDALPETGTPDTARGVFNNNDAVSLGMKVGYRF